MCSWADSDPVPAADAKHQDLDGNGNPIPSREEDGIAASAGDVPDGIDVVDVGHRPAAAREGDKRATEEELTDGSSNSREKHAEAVVAAASPRFRTFKRGTAKRSMSCPLLCTKDGRVCVSLKQGHALRRRAACFFGVCYIGRDAWLGCTPPSSHTQVGHCLCMCVCVCVCVCVRVCVCACACWHIGTLYCQCIFVHVLCKYSAWTCIVLEQPCVVMCLALYIGCHCMCCATFGKVPLTPPVFRLPVFHLHVCMLLLMRLQCFRQTTVHALLYTVHSSVRDTTSSSLAGLCRLWYVCAGWSVLAGICWLLVAAGWYNYVGCLLLLGGICWLLVAAGWYVLAACCCWVVYVGCLLLLGGICWLLVAAGWYNYVGCLLLLGGICLLLVAGWYNILLAGCC